MAVQINDYDAGNRIDLRKALNRVKPSEEKLEGYTMEHLPLNSFQLDPAYQRELNSPKLREMVKDFSPMLLLPLAVNVRNSGELFLVDGQHRKRMLTELGKGDANVMCATYYGLTPQEEAWLFDELNKLQTKLTPLQQYRGGIAAGNPMWLDIKHIVERSGFVIRPEQHELSKGNIPSVAALRKVRKQYAGGHLEKTLGLIAQTWGADHGPSQYLLLSTADFVYLYEGWFTPKRFVTALGRITPEVLTSEAKAAKAQVGLHIMTAWNFRMIEHYNRGLADDKKLMNAMEMRAIRAAQKAQG